MGLPTTIKILGVLHIGSTTFYRAQLTLSKTGLIHRQFKPVYWSPSSGTALAEAELEYDEQHVSHAAFIKFKIVTIPPALKLLLVGDQDLYALIWTTTPWTLPANQAIAVHSNVKYSIMLDWMTIHSSYS